MCVLFLQIFLNPLVSLCGALGIPDPSLKIPVLDDNFLQKFILKAERKEKKTAYRAHIF